ncbi:MAG: prepilin-type N-terminal cleavage/methylation domain-containing protein [Nitrospirae bacterium]|nr:MAG: prepilin-type N-terminal cleavage/methylation domain-containing protein [Nitrospirota bacterium]
MRPARKALPMGASDGAWEQGFTLIELMIAVLIFAVISLAAFSVLSTSQQAAVMNDQTVQLQRNVRLAMDLIARDIRMTGYGNPAAGSLAGCANHLNTGDQAVGADTGPDSISVMTIDQQVGTLAAQTPLPPATLTNQITLSGLAAGAVAVGDVITLEGAFTASVNAVAGSALTLSQAIQNPIAFQAGTPVLRLTCVTYDVTGIGVTPPFQLRRNGTAIVDGIESIQFAYAVDANGDGQVDDQAGGVANQVDCLDFIPNNGPCTDGTTNYAAGVGTVTTLPASVNATPTSVRQVRITVVARAIPSSAANVANNTWKDPTFTGGSAVTAEDQVIASAPGIRRRALTRVVSLRDASQS